MSDSAKDTIEVAPGVHMPRIGFGVYKSPPETCVASCLEAIKDGYTLIDSAMYYANECAYQVIVLVPEADTAEQT